MSGLVTEHERQIKVWYGPHLVGKHCLDLIVERTAVVELKANQGIIPIHIAQLRSYLQATEYPIGFLLNFGTTVLQWELLYREEVAEKPE